MKNYMQISSGVNVTHLMMELQRQPELWNQITTRLAFPTSPHRDSDDIWLRYKDQSENIATGDFRNFADEHDPIWYPAFNKLPSASSMIFDLMAFTRAERLGGVLIWRVQPGKCIYPHADKGWHAEYYDKFNITLQGSDGCAFYYPEDNEAMRPHTGDVHWFRNTIPHGVKNESNDDFIVMCVCMKTHTSGTGGK